MNINLGLFLEIVASKISSAVYNKAFTTFPFYTYIHWTNKVKNSKQEYTQFLVVNNILELFNIDENAGIQLLTTTIVVIIGT